MIKKIPIKGISRDPSGQISGDGFCSESLNVQLDMGEVAPAINPKRVKDAAGNEISVEGEILFIHKGIGYENLIYRNANVLSYVAVIGSADSGLVYDGLAYDETVNDITSIGNTVIVSTSKDMYYILWKDGEYRFLGHQIPVPEIYFRMGNLESLRTEPSAAFDTTTPTPVIPDGLIADGFSRSGDDCPIFKHQTIGDTENFGSPSKRYTFDVSYQEGFWNEYLDNIWGMIDSQMREQAINGKAVFPIFVRYAVRLYDGTFYAQSIPILVGAELKKYVDAASIILQMATDEKHLLTVVASKVELAGGYSIVMNADSQRRIFDGWEDIVKSVDVFISRQLVPLQRNAARFKMEYVWNEVTDPPTHGYVINDFILDPFYTEVNQEKLLLGYQDTYLAKSYQIEQFKALSGDVLLNDIDYSADYILSQEALKETSQSMHHFMGENLFTYNKRLLISEAKQTIYNGYPFIHSSKWGTTAGYPVRIRYHLRGDSGEAYVISRDIDGNGQITPKSAAVVNNDSTLYIESPVSWLAYPDSRCFRIDVYFVLPNGRASYVSYQTNQMDLADVSFVFLGFGVDIEATGSVELPTGEVNTFEMQNTLVVSKANNPFVFPAEDSVTFTAGKIMNLAVANVPLSEGQAGQFPLYVFTDEGVYAMTVDAEGKLRTSHNVSRDVLISKDAVIGIEQGVFFAAARGLLLLQGSKVTKVSSQMEGLPDILAEELLGRISDQLLGFFPDNPQAFRYFLSDCFLAYDYANTRIIVLNPRFNAQYVYKFDSQSWHRLQTDFAKPVRALNSFPEAQIVMQSGNRQAVLDFSVLAENEDAEPLNGFIYTRDLSLDGADIYKTISRLKVRGRFKDGHVKWQLQGSNDGIDYHTIHSLRGPSWKWYRIVLVTLLDKDERISYIELDYTPRFTDKIR